MRVVLEAKDGTRSVEDVPPNWAVVEYVVPLTYTAGDPLEGACEPITYRTRRFRRTPLLTPHDDGAVVTFVPLFREV